MSENDTVQVSVVIRCEEAVVAMFRFLGSEPLPTVLTDDQLLVNLMTACGNARQRLRETSGG